MAHGNNRSAAKPRSTFQVAGGTIIKYRHPFLSGQINEASPVDEIDVSRALRLNDTFLDAQPSQDSSFQEVLVDGSTITITNHLMNGSMTLQVVRTTGLVGDGDLIAAAHLVIASKDDVGGTVTLIEYINGKRLVTIYWGVSWKNVPHMRKAGNAVMVYPITMLYAGWVQGVSSSGDVNEKQIWAVGNKYGLTSVYKPYSIQDPDDPSGNKFYNYYPLTEEKGGGEGRGDDATGDLTDKDGVPFETAAISDPLPEGMAGEPAPGQFTWKTP